MAVSVYLVIAVQTLLLLAVQFGDKLPMLSSKFVARKTCHAGSGFLMLYLDSTAIEARLFVAAVVATSLAVTWEIAPIWVPPFRFGQPRDAGITIYLGIVALWFWCQQPPAALAPLFFAVRACRRAASTWVRCSRGGKGRGQPSGKERALRRVCASACACACACVCVCGGGARAPRPMPITARPPRNQHTGPSRRGGGSILLEDRAQPGLVRKHDRRRHSGRAGLCLRIALYPGAAATSWRSCALRAG